MNNVTTNLGECIKNDIIVHEDSVSTKKEYSTLPKEAHKFIGEWNQVSTDGYDLFLKEVMNLSWMTRKIALHIKPKSTWYIEDEKLYCKIKLVGLKTIVEQYGSESSEFYENDENINNVTWHMKVFWDPQKPGVLCTDKCCPEYNKGRKIEVRRWVDASCLYISHTWAPGKIFTQKCVKDL
tara:strand:+ start:574 stop:1116 length:543 start_codon:yes stop_codon:yes gene_type:complete